VPASQNMSTIHPEGSVVLIREYHNAEDTEPLFVEPDMTTIEPEGSVVLVRDEHDAEDTEPLFVEPDWWHEPRAEIDAEVAEDTQEQQARTVAWGFYAARVVGTTIVLALDWDKPCDQPLKVAVVLMLVIDIAKLAVWQNSHETQMSPEMRRMQLVLQLLHFNAFVMALVCFWRTNTCDETSPNLWRLVFVLLLVNGVAVAMCMLFVICGCFLVSLATILRCFGVLRHPGEPAAASTEFINSLPVIRYQQTCSSEDGEDLESDAESRRLCMECSICLENFEQDDELRELPCLHTFHVACVDAWLKINKTCPLCKHDAETPMAIASQAEI